VGDPLALVTGVAGFIGRHVSRSLARDGFEVIGIGPGVWSDDEREASGVTRWIPGEVSAARLRSLERAPAVVFHCAGSGSVGRAEDRPDEERRRSVGSVVVLLEYLAEVAPQARVVFPSSVSVYGSTLLPAPEDAPLRPCSAYAHHKVAAECLVTSYGEHAGADVAIVRLPSVYGPGLRKQLLWDACTKLSHDNGTFQGSGNELREWLHVDDGVRLLRLAAERAARPLVVNGGTGFAASVSEVISEIAAALGWTGALRFTGSARPGNPENLRGDAARARALGWAPRTTWQEGVREYCEWFCGEAR
jgi:UDP-glucose 4-epimerase